MIASRRSVAAALVALGTISVLALTSCVNQPDDPPAASPARSTTPSRHDTGSLAAARVALAQVADVDGTPTGLAFRAGDPAIYAAVREGRVVRISEQGGSQVLLDLSSEVSTDGEGGVFDVAFTRGGSQLLVSYADAAAKADVVVRVDLDEQGRVHGHPERIIEVGEGGQIHNAGRLVVTDEGDVLLAVGDGGEWNDVAGRARRGGSERGRILRYAGLGRSDAEPVEPTTVAWGLRNPWRFFVDPVTGDTWIGDVGQARWEEVDRIPADAAEPPDFGWDLTEGFERARGLPPEGMTFPVMVGPHDDTHCAIIGGPIVRDRAVPDLVGTLVLGDYCSGDVRFVRTTSTGAPIEHRRVALPGDAKVSSFATGLDHAVYVLRTDGVISRLDAGGRPLRKDPAPLATEPKATFEGPRSICGLGSAIAAYPAMQGKPPAEVEVLARDLQAALAAYRGADLPEAATEPFDRLDAGLQEYLRLLEAAGWDTQAPSVRTGSDAITAGAKDYASVVNAEAASDACS